MDRETLAVLADLVERAATALETHGFARESIVLENPTHDRLLLAGEFLVEQAADRFPALDPYVASSTEGTITLVLDPEKTR
ncbi:hypothetical protein ID144_22340 [Pseudomonas sp. JM0905a]|uniref:Uncharacterized protein n=1 Tax=Metapseudomonas resinovorans TaxID=53412 RepID=A0ABT4Y952_METRE|nr:MULTISPECIES: hypothetical protein [Pseudomonas]MBD2839789.1 hypothetical protein [Pseudomonas sp. JM0905a]MDA8485408.1 hypothetical protein [Pseudomonas resinovorans]